MFYHTTLMNSPFCALTIADSMRFKNFKQDFSNRSCVCDQVIDACGCSPSFYRLEDATQFTVTLDSCLMVKLMFELPIDIFVIYIAI